VPFSGKKEHMRKVHGSLLSPGYAGKSQKHNAFLRSPNDSASPRFGYAPFMGWKDKTSNLGQKNSWSSLKDKNFYSSFTGDFSHLKEQS
jgi:hypothetical protein